MTVSDGVFTGWLEGVDAPTRSVDLAALTGESSAKIRAQRIRSRVAYATIVTVSRALERDPVTDLSTFDGLAALARDPAPRTREVLSQLHAEDVFVEILKRRRIELSHALSGYALQGFPFAESTRYWVNAIDSEGTLRRHIADATRTDITAVSRAISNNALTVDQCIAVAQHAGASARTGLMLTGVLTPEEAGWSRYERENSLLTCSDSELLDLADERQKTLRRAVAEVEDEKQFWSTLG